MVVMVMAMAMAFPTQIPLKILHYTVVWMLGRFIFFIKVELRATIGLATAVFFLGSPVLLALLYMGQPRRSVILRYTVYTSQVVYAYFVSNHRC